MSVVGTLGSSQHRVGGAGEVAQHWDSLLSAKGETLAWIVGSVL